MTALNAALVLALVLLLAGCAVPIAEPADRYEWQMKRRERPRETALAAAITDAWQARTFRQKNRHTRSRRACSEHSDQAVCRALAKKHRREERRDRRGYR